MKTFENFRPIPPYPTTISFDLDIAHSPERVDVQLVTEIGILPGETEFRRGVGSCSETRRFESLKMRIPQMPLQLEPESAGDSFGEGPYAG